MLNTQKASRPLKVIIIAQGSGGDIFPNIRIGKALLARGHEIVFVTNELFADAARSAGFRFVPLGTAEEAREVMSNPDLWKRGKGFRVFFDSVLRQMDDTYEIISREFLTGETIVLAPFTAFAARVAQEKLGIPLATVVLQPLPLRSLNVQPGVTTPDRFVPVLRILRRGLLSVLDRSLFDPVLAPKINEFRAKLNLSPVKRLLGGWVHSPELVIGMFPEWFARPQPDWPPNTHLTGFPISDGASTPDLTPELNAFLDAGDPPVVFTMGTAMQFAGPVFQGGLRACHELGRRVLFLCQYADQVPPDLPSTAMHVQFAPFERLLPRASALVHHGGIGTVAQALASGVPQLIAPLNTDQPDNANRAKLLGVADTLSPRNFTPTKAKEKLRHLLTSATVRENCQGVAQRFIDSDPYARTCALVEGLTVKKSGDSQARHSLASG